MLTAYMLAAAGAIVFTSVGFMLAAFRAAGRIADLEAENARLATDLLTARRDLARLTDRDERGRYTRNEGAVR